MAKLDGLNKKLKAFAAKHLRGGTPYEAKGLHEHFDTVGSRPDYTHTLPNSERLEIKGRMQTAMYEQITQRVAANAKARTIRLRWTAAAALLIVSCSVGLSYWIINTGGQGELSVGKSEQVELVLSDGTKIRMNSSSKLTYPKTFGQTGAREVILVGEAFFDVAHDSDRPFLIHTPSMEIRVLGTSFNVRDYDADATAETALISGKVEVAHKDRPDEKFYLDPNQKFTVFKQEPPVVPSEPYVQNRQDIPQRQRAEVKEMSVVPEGLVSTETEWMLRRITVDDESLGSLSRRLERMYDVTIVFDNENTAKQLYSATFDDEALEDILKALQTVVPFQYRKEGSKKIIIY